MLSNQKRETAGNVPLQPIPNSMNKHIILNTGNENDPKTPILSEKSDIDIDIDIDTDPLYAKTQSTKTHRLSSFDIFRGLIMILMLIDHTDSSITITNAGSEYWTILNPSYFVLFDGNVALAFYKFFWRFLSGICAPGFFLLMGFGLVYFYRNRLEKLKWTIAEIAKFLFARAILLMVCNVVYGLMYYPWQCDYSAKYPCDVFLGGVLYGLSINLFLSIPILIIDSHFYSKQRFYFSYGLLTGVMLFSLISTHFMTPKYDEYETIQIEYVKSMLYVPQFYAHSAIGYPALPWLSFVMLGMMIARSLIWYRLYYKHKMYVFYIYLFSIGLLMLISFIVIRLFGSLDFGNFGWHWYDTELVGAGGPWIGIQFFLPTKYPPSLSFFLLWNGNICIILSFIYYLCDYKNYANQHGQVYQIILVYGNVALFFFVLHFAFILEIFYAVNSIYYTADYDRKSWWAQCVSLFLCAVLLAILYPICKWYKQFKAKQTPTSLIKLC